MGSGIDLALEEQFVCGLDAVVVCTDIPFSGRGAGGCGISTKQDRSHRKHNGGRGTGGRLAISWFSPSGAAVFPLLDTTHLLWAGLER